MKSQKHSAPSRAGALALISCGLIGASLSPANAAAYPYPAEYSFDGASVTGPGDYARAFDGSSSGSATLGATPSPSVHLHAETLPEYPGSSLAEAEDHAAMRYYYQIFGDFSSRSTVESVISFSLGVQAHRTGTIGSYFVHAGIGGDDIPISSETYVCLASGGTFCNGYNPTASGPLAVGLPQFGSITLDTYIEGDGISADAYADPVITLPSGYTITFSPGIGNSTAADPGGPGPTGVPEPASLMLLAGALVGAAGLRRRR